MPEDCVLTVRENPNPFVSRGALKLQNAVTKYDTAPERPGALPVDVGASSRPHYGTACFSMGLSKVYSIDVGYGQLDWRSEERRAREGDGTHERAQYDERLVRMKRLDFCIQREMFRSYP